MIHEAVAVVAAIFSWGVQPHHHLVPPTIFAQLLGEPRQVAPGQPFDFLHHLLSPVHGVETVHPKHDLNLHLQGEQTAKRFVLRVDQPSAVHPDTVNFRQLISLRSVPLFILSCPPITYSR